MNHDPIATEHLTDGELFALAVPPAGAPEPLPAHLSECLECSRALADWKAAMRDLAREDEDVLAERSPDEWRAAEDTTLAAVRRAGAAGRGRARVLGWASAAAAAALVAVLISGRGAAPPAGTVFEDTAEMSTADRADDVLLRDVERLAGGEEGGWGELAPVPADATPLEEAS